MANFKYFSQSQRLNVNMIFICHQYYKSEMTALLWEKKEGAKVNYFLSCLSLQITVYQKHNYFHISLDNTAY